MGYFRPKLFVIGRKFIKKNKIFLQVKILLFQFFANTPRLHAFD